MHTVIRNGVSGGSAYAANGLMAVRALVRAERSGGIRVGDVHPRRVLAAEVARAPVIRSYRLLVFTPCSGKLPLFDTLTK